ncbi:MAG: ABC transporter permease [Ancalomicrobiaceae bacterium]|nr:ABC transporter permease [Ancalomicrobiaceae bacterium]
MNAAASSSPTGSTAPVLGNLARHSFLLVMLACFLFFAVYNGAFLSLGNLTNILEGSAILLVVALGMTLVVALGGIDLSVGVALDFGAAFAIVAMKDYDASWYVAILCGLAGGAIVGLLNAILVVRLSVSPFLATLGVFFIGGSVQRIFTNGGGPISFRRLPTEYYNLAVGNLFGIPMKIVIGVVVLAAFYVLLERSVFGKRFHAIGMQPSAARIAGINVKTYTSFGFIVASMTCAIGGIMVSANLRMFTPLAGNAYLMQSIAAVFIGASMHPRGRPNVLGTAVGVVFLGMIANGLNLMGLDFNAKDALSGIILVVALVFAIAQRRLKV